LHYFAVSNETGKCTSALDQARLLSGFGTLLKNFGPFRDLIGDACLIRRLNAFGPLFCVRFYGRTYLIVDLLSTMLEPVEDLQRV